MFEVDDVLVLQASMQPELILNFLAFTIIFQILLGDHFARVALCFFGLLIILVEIKMGRFHDKARRLSTFTQKLLLEVKSLVDADLASRALLLVLRPHGEGFSLCRSIAQELVDVLLRAKSLITILHNIALLEPLTLVDSLHLVVNYLNLMSV